MRQTSSRGHCRYHRATDLARAHRLREFTVDQIVNSGRRHARQRLHTARTSCSRSCRWGHELPPVKCLGDGSRRSDPPLQGQYPQHELTDLRRRIAATRWPEKELVADPTQGVQFNTVRKLASHWSKDYDWRKCDAPRVTGEALHVDGGAHLEKW
ncbi:epoxide hydrolase N-terminal domain-containing protein [Rhizobium tubonense]|uniref:epoxide hydrolase N-terminal domain-containing protein n=1 Tax=Rhizobium tubonense TaxID=484088 RepID=UPI001FCE8BFB|nr:epoxide hydrolase N-terminal domain-containing protein [Rhizobium tubonense]